MFIYAITISVTRQRTGAVPSSLPGLPVVLSSQYPHARLAPSQPIIIDLDDELEEDHRASSSSSSEGRYGLLTTDTNSIRGGIRRG